MANDKTPRYRRLTESGEVARGPCLFYGIQISATQTNEQTKVYAGPDENDMYLFENYRNPSKYTTQFWLPEPVPFDQGLYIKLGDSVTSVLVLFEDKPT